MFFLRVVTVQRNKASRGSTTVSLSKLARLWMFLLFSLSFCCTAVGSAPQMTKIEFVLVTPALEPNSLGAKAKVMYLAGSNYARIEQPADLVSDRKNLIIVNNRDVWVIDARTATGRHQVNHDVDFSVHNPILGPDCPAALQKLEYGHEIEFIDQSHAISLGHKRIGSAECDVFEVKSGDYRIVSYICTPTRCPVLIEVFKAEDSILHINYLTCKTGIPFDSAIFVPPKGVTFSEGRE